MTAIAGYAIMMYEKRKEENMSLDNSVMAMVEGWYEDYLEQGYSSEKAADLAQEKFENEGQEPPSLLKDPNHE